MLCTVAIHAARNSRLGSGTLDFTGVYCCARVSEGSKMAVSKRKTKRGGTLMSYLRKVNYTRSLESRQIQSFVEEWLVGNGGSERELAHEVAVRFDQPR